MTERSVRDWLVWAREQLLPLTVLSPPSRIATGTLDLEAQVLLSFVLQRDRTWLLVHSQEKVPAADGVRFQSLVTRRAQSEPVSYLTGIREFYSLEFRVSPSVLIPRPETEALVDRAVERLKIWGGEVSNSGPLYVIDVGTGSGAIVLATLDTLVRGNSLLSDRVRGIGIDLSAEALETAKLNARHLGLERNVDFIRGDTLSAIGDLGPQAQIVITANLPYVPSGEVLPRDVAEFEPALALRGGLDGLEIIRKFLAQLADLSGGRISVLMEVGAGQVSTLKSSPHNLERYSISSWSDFAGVERFLELNEFRG